MSRFIRCPGRPDLVLINGRWEPDPLIGRFTHSTPTPAEDVTQDIGGARAAAAKANGGVPVEDVTQDIGGARAAAARANGVLPVTSVSPFGAQAAAMRAR